MFLGERNGCLSGFRRSGEILIFWNRLDPLLKFCDNGEISMSFYYAARLVCHSVIMASFPFMLTFFSAISSDKARASEGRATPKMKATSC